jgi:hypothetical protein
MKKTRQSEEQIREVIAKSFSSAGSHKLPEPLPRKTRAQLGLSVPDDLKPEEGKTIELTRELWLDSYPSREELDALRKASPGAKRKKSKKEYGQRFHQGYGYEAPSLGLCPKNGLIFEMDLAVMRIQRELHALILWGSENQSKKFKKILHRKILACFNRTLYGKENVTAFDREKLGLSQVGGKLSSLLRCFGVPPYKEWTDRGAEDRFGGSKSTHQRWRSQVEKEFEKTMWSLFQTASGKKPLRWQLTALLERFNDALNEKEKKKTSRLTAS